MPTRNEIHLEIIKTKSESQDKIRRRYLKKLARYTKRNTIVYATAFTANKGP